MTSKAATVEEYLAELPEDRRASIQRIRETILANLPEGYEEGMQYGGVGYYVPKSLYPPGYHCDPKQPLPFAGLANQKNHIGLYLYCIYTDEEAQRKFVEGWTKSGKKLDMGKSCVRVRTADDVPMSVLGEAIRSMPVDKFVSIYEANMPPRRK